MGLNATAKSVLTAACCCLLLSACASTARGIRDSVYQPKPGLEAVDTMLKQIASQAAQPKRKRISQLPSVDRQVDGK